MIRQFTATVYILEEQRVLLIKHKKMNKWLPPGGHLLPNETPVEGVHREALEETGLQIELIPQENIWIDHWNARSMLRPYQCLIEEIPSMGNEAAHQHIDFIYLGKPIAGVITQNRIETDGIRWMTIKEVENLISDVEIFEETKQTIRAILTNSVQQGAYV